MKRLFFLFAATAFSFVVNSQNLTQKEMGGEWKTIQIIEKPSNPQLLPLAEGFKNAVFSFNQDNNFKISSTSATDMFKMITNKTANSQWTFVQNGQFIKIGNKENEYTKMGIMVEQTTNGKVLFHLLDETEMTLEVKKI